MMTTRSPRRAFDPPGLTARRWLAAVWIALVATAAVGHVADVPLAIVGAWFGALVMLGGTGSTAKAQADERLERPRTYRAVAAIGFAVPLGAALLTWVPHHADWATMLSPTSCSSRGSRIERSSPAAELAMLAMTISLFAWLPFMVLMCIGCKCARYDPPPPHWTETVSWLALLATQLMNGLTVAAALDLVRRRTEEAARGAPARAAHHGAGL